MALFQHQNTNAATGWKVLFFGLVLFYCRYYAPYGINETDGGFLNGLAWQLLNGKRLYSDIVYVRPPVPVWLHALELKLLPVQFAVLGSRWLFYLKMALCSWFAAAVLVRSDRRWLVATFGFVVSIHCYPATAWHTVDGILFGTGSIWCWSNRRSALSAFCSGLLLTACLMCKQSFYPMGLIWLVLMLLDQNVEKKTGNADTLPQGWLRTRLFWALSAFALSAAALFFYFKFNGSLPDFWALTTGASSGNEAIQHGILDYCRIKPALAVFSILALGLIVWCFLRFGSGRFVFVAWISWLLVLAGSYTWAIYQRQEFTAPFAQTRLLFLVALAWGIFQLWQKQWTRGGGAQFMALMGLSWCAALSWGYNLPVLLATPWVFAAVEISTALYSGAFRTRANFLMPLLALTGLLFLFRFANEYVYRDGSRAMMRTPLCGIFPALGGIYSTEETAALYQDLNLLVHRYGPDFKTLPAFPEANFLTLTRPVLPLDWVVEREMNRGRGRVIEALETNKPVLFIEKEYAGKIQVDPELRLTLEYMNRGRVVEETPFFWVVKF